MKNKIPKEEDEETLKRTTKRSIINKRIFNLQKIVKEEEEPKEVNVEIPPCPITQTINYLKNAHNRSFIQYIPEDIYSIPPKEQVLISDIKNIKKEKENIKN